MALAEQPLKKRRLPEEVIDPRQQMFVSPLPQDEILRKQRNKGELRSLFDCYRRIKFCISQKDDRLMPDFEQAYLALITASRGCTSAQRIISELIPRYASHCPTALEAATKVAINMYNWNLATIVRGDDFDGVAFQTAKACIFGLVDICCTASSEAPTSSVIRGICSAVFLNVLTFFLSSFEGKDIFQICDKEMLKAQDSELFSELKLKVEGEDEPALSKLFKFRVLSLLRIFFCYPKNLFEACFELFKSSSADVRSFERGNYFLRQVTSQISSADVSSAEERTNQATSSTDAAETNNDVLDKSKTSEDASLVTKNCLAVLALAKDPSLRHWIFVKYKRLCKSVSSQALSDISSAFEGIFKSFLELVKEVDSQENSDDDNLDPSKYISRQYLTPRSNSWEKSRKDSTPTLHNASPGDAFHKNRDFGKSSGLVPPPEFGIRSVNENLNQESEALWSAKVHETGDFGNSFSGTHHMNNNNYLKRSLDVRKDAVEGRNHLIPGEKNHIINDFSSSAMRSTSGDVSNVLVSPGQHSSVQNHSSNHTVWYFDGDSAAMDVFSASKLLWLGPLGQDASETGVKFQVEKFGPVQQYFFVPIKSFAVVEYVNIVDAIKAREYMRRSSPWGGHLQVKFLDVGLGSRGSFNGVAVGSSRYVYVGNVSSKWVKEDMLHELMRVGLKTHMVSDLPNESALLMEFDTAKEAAVVMGHLRKHRKENGYHLSVNRSLTSKEGLSNVLRCQRDGGRFNHSPVSVDLRSNISGTMSNNMAGSPHPPVFDTIENSKTRMSQLSSLILSLSSKYNIPRNYQAIATRDEERPTSTLWIGLPHISSTFLTDDELMTVCGHAVGNVGSVVRLTRENMQMSSCWFVELSSVDAAIIALKNLRSCPSMFFQIEFSQPGKSCSTPFVNRRETGNHELISPRMDSENHATIARSGHTYPMNWTSSGCPQMMEDGPGNYSTIDGPNSNLAIDLSQAGHTVSHASGQMWTYNPPETELQFSSAGGMQCPPMAAQGPVIVPPQQNQASAFMRPPYGAPQNSWDGQTQNQRLPPMHITPSIMPSNFLVNVGVAPFLPASVTPLAQLSGATMQHVDQMVTMPSVPSFAPVPPNMGPPSLFSPPPLPMSQPPLVPPPPSSPPPGQSSIEPPGLERAGQGVEYQWQGVLCKSGVNYCTVYAHKEDSDACKYSNGTSEPTGWPARLDVTKRTDFQHVKSTFTSTPPHKREVCRLLPSTSGDRKGFQDFISYLKQRECAGVIKIPAANSMWSRLLFILPYLQDTCSMLGISPHPSDCLIAVVLPKETHTE